MGAWKTLSTKTVYQNKWLRLDEDEVINPLGESSVYSHFELDGGFIMIVPIDTNNNVYLTQQYRYPLKTLTWELPAGQTDGQNYHLAAARELEEETGLRATSLEKIGIICADTGLSGTKGEVLLATGLETVTNRLDQLDGIIQSKPFSITEIRRMIKQGEIICPHSIASFYMALEHRGAAW